MKKYGTRILAFAAATVMLVTGLGISPSLTSSAKEEKIVHASDRTQKGYISLSGDLNLQVSTEPPGWGTEFSNSYKAIWVWGVAIDAQDKDKVKYTLKANKPVKIKKDKKKNGGFYICPEQPGKIKFTMVAKCGKKQGKTVFDFRWGKYSNPVKSIEIGKKQYPVEYLDGDRKAWIKPMKKPSTVDIKLSKRYEIIDITFVDHYKRKAIKEGEKVLANKKGQYIEIYYKDKKHPHYLSQLCEIKLEVGEKNAPTQVDWHAWHKTKNCKMWDANGCNVKNK